MSNAAKAHTFKIQYTTAKECAVFGKMVFSQEFETAEQLEAEMEMMAMAEGVTHWMAQFSDGTVIENGVVIDGITVVHTDNYSDQLGRFKHDNFGRGDFLSGTPD